MTAEGAALSAGATRVAGGNFWCLLRPRALSIAAGLPYIRP